MRLQEFTTRAPTPEPSKDVPEVPGQMTVDEVIADVGAAQSITEVTPSGLEIYYSWAPKRLYRIRRADPSMGAREPLEVPSVTTVLDVLNKGGLTWWGMQVGIAGCVTLADKGILTLASPVENSLLEEQILGKLVEHKLTVNDDPGLATKRGNTIHRALEAWADGKRASSDEFEELERDHFNGLDAFLETIDQHVTDIESEVMVGSLEHLYAGRCDLALTLKEPIEVVTRAFPKRNPKVEEIPAGRYRIDMKTRKPGKHTYETDFLQLEAYEGAAIESGYSPTDYRAVLVVTPGKYELAINKEWTFEDFQVVRQAYSVMHERDRLKNEREVLAELREKLGAMGVA